MSGAAPLEAAIEPAPAEKIGLSAIARHVGLSLFHFRRLFQAVMGESPSA
ncbi:helix-turn-helix transcriptional regulator [Methylobacterium sp. P5_C11]